MPAATNTFQQIAGSDPGPFTQFLRPHVPIDYGQTAATPLSNTGYESAMTGTGKTVLSFLQGVTQERRRKAELQDADTQTGIDNFQKHVTAMLANPDLTDAGREAIRNEADSIMNQHMHYEMKDIPKDGGIHGFLKNILTQATGGGIKTREPINWNEATGRITNVRKPEHSQDNNFKQIVSDGEAAVAEMERQKAADHIVPSAEDYKGVWHKQYLRALTESPNNAGKLWEAAAQGGMPASSTGYQVAQNMQDEPIVGKTTIPNTGQPPAKSAEPYYSAQFYYPKPVDTSIPSSQDYSALHPGQQHPFTPGAIPLDPETGAALAGTPYTPVKPPVNPGPPDWVKQMFYGAPGSGSLTVGQSVPTVNGRPVQVRRTGLEPPQPGQPTQPIQ